MLRKIERDERKPSEQLAELLADQLAVEGSQRVSFLQLARGKFVAEMASPTAPAGSLIPLSVEMDEPVEEELGFVARSSELSLLHDHLHSAMEQQGKMVFIAGEAGRGKTTLLHEFARQALQAHPGLMVLGGSSDIYTGQGDPLLPFRAAFRMLTGEWDRDGAWGMVSREHAARLSQAVPALAATLLDYGPHLIDTLVPGAVLEGRLSQSYPHHARNTELLLRLREHRQRQVSSFTVGSPQSTFFEEIASTLTVLAQQQPLMLILDDLHWIDHSSADLLVYLVRRIRRSPMLIVGSYRPEDLTLTRYDDGREERARHPLHEVLSESLRQFGQNRIDLDHFDVSDELELTGALMGLWQNDFSEAFRRQMAQLTEGNPLFVLELLCDMSERGDILKGEDGRWRESSTVRWDLLPAKVEGIIEKRITGLPDDLRLLITIGSVQGVSFFAEVIARVVRSQPEQLIRPLSAELDNRYRLIHELGILQSGGERLSQYRFRHHLFQMYLYEHLGAAERMYFHEAVGNALEALLAGAQELPAAQLARHFQEARLSERASRYLLVAGQQAMRLLAFDEAIAHFESGLVELKRVQGTQEVLLLEFELYLDLARARWHDGRVKEAVDAFQEATKIARQMDDPRALAEAVLAYEEPRWRLNLDTEFTQPLMREALAELGDDQSGLRVRLLVGLARSLLASGEQAELRATVEQALRIARQVNDPVALCDVLRIKVQIDRRPAATAARLAASQEFIATAKLINDLERQADGIGLLIYDLLELGEIDQVDAMIAEQRQIAFESRQPFQVHVASVFQTMRAILSGHFEQAEALAKDAAGISQQIGVSELDGIYGTHMFTIRREQGRMHEIAQIVRILLAHNPQSSAWRPGLALIYSSLGQLSEARAVFDGLVGDGIASMPVDSLWVGTMAYLSEVCASLGDGEQAAVLYDLLLPYESRAVVVGGATVCLGAVGRFLGMLARTMSKWELAERHIQEAIRLDERMHGWPWLAHSQAEYAALMLERGKEEDRHCTQVLLDEALSAARRMGMGYLREKVETLQAGCGFASKYAQ